MDSKEDSSPGKIISNTKLISPHYLLMMAGRLLPLISLFGAAILYAHSLSPADYALYQSVWMYVNLVAVIIGFGITTVIFSTQSASFIQFVKANIKVILPFYTILWATVLLLFAIASQQYAFSLKIWVILFMILQASNSITESWLIKNGGEIRYFAINILYSIVFFSWHYLVLYNGFDLEWLIKGILCFSLAKFLAIFTFAARHLRVARGNAKATGLFAHWTYNGINDIVGILSKWIDKLIMIYLLTPSEFAIFFNGSIEIPLLSIFVSFAGSLMMVQMTRRMEISESVVPVFRENFLLLSTIIFPVFFFLFFFSEPVFLLFFGPQYIDSVPIFTITILILPLRINNYGSILQVIGKGKLVTQGSIIDLILCIVLVFILYPILGMRGAALAMVLSTLIQISYYLWNGMRLLKTTLTALIPFKTLLIRFVACGILFWLLLYFIHDFNYVSKIICGCILIFICFLIAGKKYFRQILRAENNH